MMQGSELVHEFTIKRCIDFNIKENIKSFDCLQLTIAKITSLIQDSNNIMGILHKENSINELESEICSLMASCFALNSLKMQTSSINN